MIRQRCPLLLFQFNTVLEVQARGKKVEIKGIWIGNEEVKCLYSYDIIWCVEDPKAPTKQISELTNLARSQDTIRYINFISTC